jgi:hypothetical protein
MVGLLRTGLAISFGRSALTPVLLRGLELVTENGNPVSHTSIALNCQPFIAVAFQPFSDGQVESHSSA